MFGDIINLFDLMLKKRFKVSIISYYYPFQKPSTSGVGIHVYNLVTALSKLGCEVHVFTYTEEKDSVSKMKVGDGKIVLHFINAKIPYDMNDQVIEKRIRYSIFQNKVLDEVGLEHNRRPFDIVHTHGWLTSSAFILKYLYKLPWFHTVHSLERNRLQSMSEEEKRLYRLTSWIEDTISDADKLIAVSEDTSKQIVRAFGKKVAKKIEVIPNGVNLELFKNLNRNNKNNLLCIARFSKEKGIDIIPGIIRTVLSNNKQCTFTLIANKSNIPTLEKYVLELEEIEKDFGSRFNWVSKPIMPIEISKYYSTSGIYVQPSYYETFGLCIAEAMASGNVIVATKVGGIPEVVGKAGILTNPKVREVSSAILNLLKNNEKYDKLRTKSLERAKQFDWKIIGDRTFELYQKLVEKRKLTKSL